LHEFWNFPDQLGFFGHLRFKLRNRMSNSATRDNRETIWLREREMPERKRLHALVDSLPDDALDSGEKCLHAIQTWPPKQREYPPEVVRRRKELEDKRDKFLSAGRGFSTGVWFIDRENKSHASFTNSEHNSETNDVTDKRFRVHHDFPIECQPQT
jgi:hypothetical protein